jgi:hypothetical protein
MVKRMSGLILAAFAFHESLQVWLEPADIRATGHLGGFNPLI